MAAIKHLLNEEPGFPATTAKVARFLPPKPVQDGLDNLQLEPSIVDEDARPWDRWNDSELDESINLFTISKSAFNGPSVDSIECVSLDASSNYSYRSQAVSSKLPVEDSTDLETSTHLDGDKICYGMIHHIAVRLQGEMRQLDTSLQRRIQADTAAVAIFSVRQTQDMGLMLHLDDKEPCAIVNDRCAKLMTQVLEHNEVNIECMGGMNAIRETIGRAERQKDAVVQVDFNIYGPRSMKDVVSKLLSSERMYLQTPDSTRDGIPYENPQMLKLPDFEPMTPLEQDDANAALTEEQQSTDNKDYQSTVNFQNTVTQLYASLTRSDCLDQVEGGPQIRTELLPHQKKAVTFMTSRESGNIPNEYRLWKRESIEDDDWFVHGITGARLRAQPDESGGGILADEMGMGKTLSIIGLIINTFQDAQVWKTQATSATMAQRTRCAATLIVVPSELLINGWHQEMLSHLNTTLHMVKHHGPKRRKKNAEYEHADIVITTYNTLSAEFEAKESPLHCYEWYRVVLDEAHIVRRQSTTFYRSVNDLKARSRWCLTGTPIQNRLEDIGSLFAWLRIRPFDSLAVFRRYIASPFDESESRRKIAIQHLTKLLDSVCLRRTKDLLALPDLHTRIRRLDLSPEERAQYKATKDMMKRAINQQTSDSESQSKFGLFQAQTQLRLLCNHGTWQQQFSWARRSILEEHEWFSPTVSSDEAVQCSGCRQPISIVGQGRAHDTYVEKCSHILCADCMEIGVTEHCPLCAATGRSSSAPSNADTNQYFRKEGHSSKIQAVVKDVQHDMERSKSIIFTCWTRTLDLIAMYLKAADISFARIDGNCPFTKRQNILNDFAKETSVPVLLMTTGTGAFGLNLTSANRVFIVEPQWNPSVENQAIARAIRLGQDREVQVTKYLMNSTTEQEMISLQKRKLGLAQMMA